MPKSDKAISADSAEMPKRGRPATYTRDAVATARMVVGRSGSDRSIIDKCRAYHAAGKLKDVPGCEWLYPGSPDGDRWRWSIFAELGKIDDDEQRAAIAKQICQETPSAKEAVQWLRKIRIGRQPKGDAINLANAMIECLNRYVSSHNDCDAELIQVATDMMVDAVRNTFSEKQLDHESVVE